MSLMIHPAEVNDEEPQWHERRHTKYSAAAVAEVDSLMALESLKRETAVEYLRSVTAKAIAKHRPQQAQEVAVVKMTTVPPVEDKPLATSPRARLRDIQSLRTQMTKTDEVLRTIFDRCGGRRGPADAAALGLALEHDLAAHDVLGESLAKAAARKLLALHEACHETLLSFPDLLDIVQDLS